MKKFVRLMLVFALLFSVQISFAQSNAVRNIAISRAKAVFVATANGDVTKLKRLTTPEFYEEHYPYSDARVREILLSVPKQKRQNMIDQIQNNSTASTIMNRAGDVITVTLTNKTSKKEFTVQLLEEDGDWKIFNYWY